MTSTFFWHDYETFGIDPQLDRASQFAGIRTDADFNIIDEPIMLYCQPARDYLPHPEACLITGISPQKAAEHGICEAKFIEQIQIQMAQPNTCTLGYNSLRFDDEVTRNLLYRNFYDPYARERQNNCSRWDLIDVARATQALRPEGINWPLAEDGSPRFKLELLTAANDIAHLSAHDALSDVHATIAIARLIKQRQPRLYDYLFANKGKAAVQDLLQLGSYTPLVHISGRFPARKNCLAIVVPICLHPLRTNEVIVYDVSIDPQALLSLSADEIKLRVFSAANALPKGVDRIPLKTIHINKCPVLAPLKTIRPQDAERLQLDIAQCKVNTHAIQHADNLHEKLAEVFSTEYPSSPSDPDLMIYSGGFFNPHDKAVLTKIRATSPDKLASFKAKFDDPRLSEMLFRYRGRNFPETLSPEESARWQHFCMGRLHHQLTDTMLTLELYMEKIHQLQAEPDTDKALLKQLTEYAVQLLA